jgi:LPXTG-motif cell wall-anchored protein
LKRTRRLISFQYESWETPGKEIDEETNENTTPVNEAISEVKLQKAIDSASQYVLKNQVGEWEAIALMHAGKKLPADYSKNIITQIKEKNGKFSKVTDYERFTLGVLAAGGNPTNVNGYNLIESIYNGNLTKQGLNGVFYGLIALDSANFEIPTSAKWSREKLVSYVLEKQNEDNGWSWDGSEKSDLDTTAMVLTSLAPYKGDKKVKSVIDEGVQYLSSQYKVGKIDNSSTAAQVVIALSAIGIDANGALFTKEGNSLISYLLTFQNTDGGFDWQGGNVSDVMSTSQGIQGIVAYQLFLNGKDSLYQIPFNPENSVTGNMDEDSSNVVEGKPLPNTATNTYNYLVFGLLLLVFGMVFFNIEKRKKA